MRAFCEGLREWKEVFLETDFKVTDGLATGKLFKALSIRKANELVAYGLAGGKSLHVVRLSMLSCCNDKVWE